MQRITEFTLDKQQQADISVEELANRIVSVLQRNAEGRRVSYYGGQLSSIKAFEILAGDSSASHDSTFELKWVEAIQRLFQGNLIVRDPSQSSDDFVVLTIAGREMKT